MTITAEETIADSLIKTLATKSNEDIQRGRLAEPPDTTKQDYLMWMLTEAQQMPIEEVGKRNRWLGYILGCIDSREVSVGSLIYVCSRVKYYSQAEANLTIGHIQGLMVKYGLTDVDTERDRVREIVKPQLQKPTDTNSYYTIVRFVPDPISEEFINVGVIAFNEDKILVEQTKDWDRVESFARGGDTEFLKDSLEILKHQAKSNKVYWLEKINREREGLSRRDLIEKMSRNWINSVQLSPPRASLDTLENLFTYTVKTYLKQQS